MVTLEDIFMWFSRSITGEHAMSYYMSHFLSSFVPSVLIALLLLGIWLLQSVINSCWMCSPIKPSSSSTVDYMMWISSWVISITLMLWIIWCLQLLTAFAIIPLYVGTPFTVVLCSLCWIHSLRISMKQTKKEDSLKMLEKSEMFHSLNDMQTCEDEYGEGLKRVLGMDTNIQSETSISRLDFIKTYPKRLWMGVKKRWLLMLIGMLLILIVTVPIFLLSCHICVVSGPLQTSSLLTRLFQEKYCKWDTICYMYATVPEDMTHSLIINFSTYSYQPEEALVYFSDGSSNMVTNATCFRMSNIFEEQRYQCWADLSGLVPDTSYTISASIVTYDSFFKTDTQKYRTAPTNGSVLFVSGGDLQWSQSALKLLNQSMILEPHFVTIGGDIAYANSIPFCWRRWDEWFKNWEKYAKTASGYNLPLLTSIGNHEASGFMRPISDNHFYLRYFPHELNLQKIDPMERKTYRLHRIGDNMVMLVLDSWIHTRPLEQVDFIRSSLQNNLHVRYKFAVYHAAVYPSKDVTYLYDRPIIEEMQKYWEPMFSKYNLTAAFENHYHAFKQSYAIQNGEVSKDGKGVLYLGDGSFGPGGSTDFVKSQFLEKVGGMDHIWIVKVSTNVTTIYAIDNDGERITSKGDIHV